MHKKIGLVFCAVVLCFSLTGCALLAISAMAGANKNKASDKAPDKAE